MSEFFEVIMVLSFGVSWPFNVVKSYKAKTAKGKSFIFMVCIILGYIAGIISKFTNDAYMDQISSKWYVLFFYFLNLSMVLADFLLYIRNRHYDKLEKMKGI